MFPWSWDRAIIYPEHFQIALVVLKCWSCLFKRTSETLTKWPKRSNFWSDDRVRASSETCPRVYSVDVIVTKRSQRAQSCQWFQRFQRPLFLLLLILDFKEPQSSQNEYILELTLDQTLSLSLPVILERCMAVLRARILTVFGFWTWIGQKFSIRLLKQILLLT